jgi:hypothetical protein
MENQPDNPELKKFKHDYIDRRWSQLYGLEKEFAERALKYLLLTNSGGAVTVLSFMGASKEVRYSFWPSFALVLFVIGVILVGFYNAKQYYHMAKLFNLWKKDAKNYFSGKITWEVLIAEDEKRSLPSIWAYILAWSSFVAFIFGCISGAISIFK